MVSRATNIQHHPVESATDPRANRPRSKKKLQALLVTADDALWPQVGAVVSSDVVLKHIDSIEQLVASIEPGHAGVVIWDARGETDYAAQLGRIQQHSARIAVVALDVPATQSQWTRLAQLNQIVSLVPIPFTAQTFNEAMNRAHDEVHTRVALLGTHDAQPAAHGPPPSKGSRMPLMIGAGVLVLAVATAIGVYEFTRSSPTAEHAALVPVLKGEPVAAAPAAHRNGGEDSVDALLEKAAQAMLDRRYIDPADNSALSYYHSVLTFDANNAEAKQGLDRLAELLLSKAQTALDQQHFDSAIQALEIARSINRNDSRLQSLDARLAKMRSELGSSLIQAAIDAGNFDRAATLIDEATHAKALTPGQLAQLREDLRRRHDESDVDRLIKTAQARVQQDHLIDPANDSAAHYFTLARKAGSASPALSEAIRDFGQHLMLAARSAIDQHRLGDADRLLSEAQSCDVPPAAIAELQRAVAAQRSELAGEKREQQRLLDLVKSRLAQGSVLEPEQDSAEFYLNSLKTADPQNAALPELSRSVQAQIVARAGSLFDQGHVAEAKSTLQSALKLGGSAEANALAEKISQAAPPASRATAALILLKPIAPKYPPDAASSGTQGWVDLAFTVEPNGHTSDIRVENAAPRYVFDRAAMDALYSARYQPIPKDQPQEPRDAKLRLTFKLNK
jgi:protein TonB